MLVALGLARNLNLHSGGLSGIKAVDIPGNG
jgi:hypothetical protein